MIPRYTRPEMARIWSDENRFRNWLAVEVAATETLAEAGIVPQRRRQGHQERADFKRRTHPRDRSGSSTRRHRLHHRGRRNRRPALPLVPLRTDLERCRGHGAGPADPASLRRSSRRISQRLADVLEAARLGIQRHAHDRPHARHPRRADHLRIQDRQLVFGDAAQHRAIHGAQRKTCASESFPARWERSPTSRPELEEKICARLGLKAAAVSSQVIQRDRHAHYLATLAVIASTLDKIATEIRHLQRTEVREAEEFFSEKQKGSSAMPHKRNPVTCEQISGLARVVRSNAQAGFENVALWHERDISHSSVERVILPDSTTLMDYMLSKTDEPHRHDVRVSRAHAGEPGKHAAAWSSADNCCSIWSRTACPARTPIAWCRRHAMRAWKEGLNFHDEIRAETRDHRRSARKQIEYAFDLQRQLKNVDKIFARVFTTKATRPTGRVSKPKSPKPAKRRSARRQQ